jgi:hypothetical protein
MTPATSPSLQESLAVTDSGAAKDLHKRYDGEQDPLAPSIQPVGPFQVEDLTSDDGAFIQDGKPRKPF